jgi:hypothetical protein
MSYKQDIENLQKAILQNNAEVFTPQVKPENSAVKRVSIYIDGYRARLHHVLKQDFPCLFHYLGERNANGLFFSYIEENPSKSYNIDYYSFNFPNWFLNKYNDKKVFELALLEAKINQVFFLPDSQAMLAENIAKILPENFGNLVFKKRNAAEILQFEFDVDDYLTNFREETPLDEIIKGTTYLFIVRHKNFMKRHRLEEEEFNFLNILFSQISFNQTIDKFNELYPNIEISEERFQKWFQNWIEGGFFMEN